MSQYSFFLILLLIPVIFWLYIKDMKKKGEALIRKFAVNSSEIYTDLDIWFKNYSIFDQEKYLDISLNETIYDFYQCDIILNEQAIIVLGKGSFMGIEMFSNPVIMKAGLDNIIDSKAVSIKKIHEVGKDLEITFIDTRYKKPITLVIKRVNSNLKEKILLLKI